MLFFIQISIETVKKFITMTNFLVEYVNLSKMYLMVSICFVCACVCVGACIESLNSGKAM